MIIKSIAVAALMTVAAIPASALEVDITGNFNRDFLIGYQSTYKDKNMNIVCDVKFWQAPNHGRSYLKSANDCVGISEKKVYNDAIKFMSKVKATTYANNFAEYFGEGPQGQKIERAKPRYRCITTSPPEGYLFKPVASSAHDGWYQLYYYPNGYKPYEYPAGIWKQLDNGSIIVNTGAGAVPVDMSKVKPCYNY